MMFYKSVIDVSCTSYFISKSDPLIMNSGKVPGQFADILADGQYIELLVDTNRHLINGEKSKLGLIVVWKKMFNCAKDFNILKHIPALVLCEYAYLDLPKGPSRLGQFKRGVEEWSNSGIYNSSKACVESHSYKEIVENLKKILRGA